MGHIYETIKKLQKIECAFRTQRQLPRPLWLRTTPMEAGRGNAEVPCRAEGPGAASNSLERA